MGGILIMKNFPWFKPYLILALLHGLAVDASNMYFNNFFGIGTLCFASMMILYFTIIAKAKELSPHIDKDQSYTK